MNSLHGYKTTSQKRATSVCLRAKNLLPKIMMRIQLYVLASSTSPLVFLIVTGNIFLPSLYSSSFSNKLRWWVNLANSSVLSVYTCSSPDPRSRALRCLEGLDELTALAPITRHTTSWIYSDREQRVDNNKSKVNSDKRRNALPNT